MKRKVMIAVLVLVVMAASMVGIIYFSDGGDYPTKIDPKLTSLTSNDVVEIKRLVRKEMRRNILPTFFWASIKAMPGNLWKYQKIKILSVDGFGWEVTHGESVVIVTTGPKGSATTNGDWVGYFVTRMTNGWEIHPGLPYIRTEYQVPAFTAPPILKRE